MTGASCMIRLLGMVNREELVCLLLGMLKGSLVMYECAVPAIIVAEMLIAVSLILFITSQH